MDNTIKYLEDEQVLVIKAQGRYPTDPAEIEKGMQFHSELRQKYNTNLFIIDYRNAVYDQTVGNILAAPERMKKHGNDDIIKAIIFEKNSRSHQNFKLALAELNTKVFLGQNKSNIKMFFDFESAIQWLRRFKK